MGIVTYAFLATERFLKLRCGKKLILKGLQSSRPCYMTFMMQAGEEEFYEIVCSEANIPFDPLELVRKGFAYSVLNIERMKQRVFGWKKFYKQDI